MAPNLVDTPVTAEGSATTSHVVATTGSSEASQLQHHQVDTLNGNGGPQPPPSIILIPDPAPPGASNAVNNGSTAAAATPHQLFYLPFVPQPSTLPQHGTNTYCHQNQQQQIYSITCQSHHHLEPPPEYDSLSGSRPAVAPSATEQLHTQQLLVNSSSTQNCNQHVAYYDDNISRMSR